jgi:hypothetical protein
LWNFSTLYKYFKKIYLPELPKGSGIHLIIEEEKFLRVAEKKIYLKNDFFLQKYNIPAYSMWIASEGQTSTHVWQSTHMSLSTFAFSFSIAIADAGHSPTQVSHPVHLFLSITATTIFTPRQLLQRGRHQHTSGSPRTCLCRLSPSHSPSRLPMPDTPLRRFRIRCIYWYQRLQPTSSLHLYVQQKIKNRFR